jgi:hypothetical protein
MRAADARGAGAGTAGKADSKEVQVVPRILGIHVLVLNASSQRLVAVPVICHSPRVNDAVVWLPKS